MPISLPKRRRQPLGKKNPSSPSRLLGTKNLFLYFLFRNEWSIPAGFFLLLLQPVQDIIVTGTAAEADAGLPIAGPGSLGQILTAVTERACS